MLKADAKLLHGSKLFYSSERPPQKTPVRGIYYDIRPRAASHAYNTQFAHCNVLKIPVPVIKWLFSSYRDDILPRFPVSSFLALWGGSNNTFPALLQQGDTRPELSDHLGGYSSDGARYNLPRVRQLQLCQNCRSKRIATRSRHAPCRAYSILVYSGPAVHRITYLTCSTSALLCESVPDGRSHENGCYLGPLLGAALGYCQGSRRSRTAQTALLGGSFVFTETYWTPTNEQLRCITWKGR